MGDLKLAWVGNSQLAYGGRELLHVGYVSDCPIPTVTLQLGGSRSMSSADKACNGSLSLRD